MPKKPSAKPKSSSFPAEASASTSSAAVPQPASTPAPAQSKPESAKAQYLSIFLFGVAAFFGVMWFNQMRLNTMTQPVETTMMDSTQQPEKTEYAMPAVKPISEMIDLPAPDLDGQTSIEAAIENRRSQRAYADQSVSLADLGQMLWSGQGVTDDQGHRAAPSARGAYPYTLYVVVRDVTDLEPGLYQYMPEDHQLGALGLANAGQLLIEAEVQENSQTAPVVIVMAAAKAKMVEIFPDSNPDKNTYLEGGHIGQNLYLQAESLGMGTVVTAGFNPKAVGEALQLDPAEEVVYLVPFGYKQSAAIEDEAAAAE